MYKVVQGNILGLPDARDFIDLLNGLGQHEVPELRSLFNHDQDLIVTRAPGRLDVMGGIADYSGSMVLELPIREATFVALQLDPDPLLRVVSLSEDSTQETGFEMPLSDFANEGEPIEYEAAREYFQAEPRQHWAAYVAGAFLVLRRELGVSFPQGARILISSSVPAGKGVSSSAALEVAVMQAVVTTFDIEVQPRELALLCQKVENMVVGAPCGIMDQMTSACGEAGRLLGLLCQPAERLEIGAIPTDVAFWGIDSGIRHSVAGADYASVRAGAFMGYRIIAELAGLRVNKLAAEPRCEIDDPKWGGYLANVSPAEFEKDYMRKLPDRVSAAEFLARYGGTTDRVTQVDSGREYAVRIPTAHPIYEHQRVRRFAELLSSEPLSDRGHPRPHRWISGYSFFPKIAFGSPGGRGRPRSHGGTPLLLGELMYESHDSYTACGLNSEGTDLLVNLVREAGPASGLFGAKITGGGSGGTVAVLGTPTAGSSIAMVCEKYARATNHHPQVFAGSSPGSAAFGYLKLKNV